MRVSREVGAENRERMLGAAARLFRERGFSGVGVDELTRTVGLTHGSLYSRFGSKDGLAAEAVDDTLSKAAEAWEDAVTQAREAGRDPFPALVERYLSAEHRDRTGSGCTLSALAAEAPRMPAAVRDSFTCGAEKLLHILAVHAPGRDAAERRRRAQGALAAMVGGIVLARTLAGTEQSDAILAAARTAALAAAGYESNPSGAATDVR